MQILSQKYQIPIPLTRSTILWLPVALLLNAPLSAAAGGWLEPDGFPNEIIVETDRLGARFDGPKAWTLSRIEYEGERLAIDVPGSSYGAVGRFTGLGFVGSGHRETGQSETVEALRVTVDGEVLKAPPRDHYRAQRFEFEKRSRIKGWRMTNRWILTDNLLEESVELESVEPMQLDMMYLFMYPWDRTKTHYAYALDDGTFQSEAFLSDHGFRNHRGTRWVALFNAKEQIGVVTRLIEAPADLGYQTRLWDRASPYKKYYFEVFRGAEIPPGEKYRFVVRTGFFRAPPDNWEGVAIQTADQLGLEP